ncbi:MAG: hypothetical protein ABIH42_00095 [Planctomycetota bacterium]
MNRLIVAYILIGLFCCTAFGDTIVLRNGSKLEGRIVQEDEKEVTIEIIGAGTITVRRSQVEEIEYKKIEEPKPEPPPPPVPFNPENPPVQPEPQNPEQNPEIKPEPEDPPMKEIKAEIIPDRAWVDEYGTNLCFIYRIDNGEIVKTNTFESSIEKLTDNLGTDLGGKEATISSLQKLTEDCGYSVVLTLTKKPAENATYIIAKRNPDSASCYSGEK